MVNHHVDVNTLPVVIICFIIAVVSPTLRMSISSMREDALIESELNHRK